MHNHPRPPIDLTSPNRHLTFEYRTNLFRYDRMHFVKALTQTFVQDCCCTRLFGVPGSRTPFLRPLFVLSLDMPIREGSNKSHRKRPSFGHNVGSGTRDARRAAQAVGMFIPPCGLCKHYPDLGVS